MKFCHTHHDVQSGMLWCTWCNFWQTYLVTAKKMSCVKLLLHVCSICVRNVPTVTRCKQNWQKLVCLRSANSIKCMSWSLWDGQKNNAVMLHLKDAFGLQQTMAQSLQPTAFKKTQLGFCVSDHGGADELIPAQNCAQTTVVKNTSSGLAFGFIEHFRTHPFWPKPWMLWGHAAHGIVVAKMQLQLQPHFAFFCALFGSLKGKWHVVRWNPIVNQQIAWHIWVTKEALVLANLTQSSHLVRITIKCFLLLRGALKHPWSVWSAHCRVDASVQSHFYSLPPQQWDVESVHLFLFVFLLPEAQKENFLLQLLAPFLHFLLLWKVLIRTPNLRKKWRKRKNSESFVFLFWLTNNVVEVASHHWTVVNYYFLCLQATATTSNTNKHKWQLACHFTQQLTNADLMNCVDLLFIFLATSLSQTPWQCQVDWSHPTKKKTCTICWSLSSWINSFDVLWAHSFAPWRLSFHLPSASPSNLQKG